MNTKYLGCHTVHRDSARAKIYGILKQGKNRRKGEKARAERIKQNDSTDALTPTPRKPGEKHLSFELNYAHCTSRRTQTTVNAMKQCVIAFPPNGTGKGNWIGNDNGVLPTWIKRTIIIGRKCYRKDGPHAFTAGIKIPMFRGYGLEKRKK